MIWFDYLTMAMQTNQEGMVKFNLNDYLVLVLRTIEEGKFIWLHISNFKKMFVLLYQETFNDLYFSYVQFTLVCW